MKNLLQRQATKKAEAEGFNLSMSIRGEKASSENDVEKKEHIGELMQSEEFDFMPIVVEGEEFQMNSQAIINNYLKESEVFPMFIDTEVSDKQRTENA